MMHLCANAHTARLTEGYAAEVKENSLENEGPELIGTVEITTLIS